MQYGLLYLQIYTHGFAVPAILDTGTMWLVVSQKLAARLPVVGFVVFLMLYAVLSLQDVFA